MRDNMKKHYTTKELEFYKKECQFNEENGELEVLELANKGKKYIAISIDTGLSVETVKRRIKSINEKIERVNKQ